jgi:hypothetical protein
MSLYYNGKNRLFRCRKNFPILSVGEPWSLPSGNEKRTEVGIKTKKTLTLRARVRILRLIALL